jgi:hypothetical protein
MLAVSIYLQYLSERISVSVQESDAQSATHSNVEWQ